MSNNMEIHGFFFCVYDDRASARLTIFHTSDEVFVPSEINNVPVTEFLYDEMYETANIRYIRFPASIKEFCINTRAGHEIVIEVDENNPWLYSDGKAVYTKDRSELIQFFALNDEEYAIQAGCKRICRTAFELLEIKRVIFPEGLNTICEDAFCYCTGLTELVLPEGLVMIEGKAFTGCAHIEKLTLPSTLEYICARAFEGCNNALEVRLPNALKEIGFAAFPDNWTIVLSEGNKNLISRSGLILADGGKRLVYMVKYPEDGILVVPEYVTEINPGVFCGKLDIRRVILPEGLHTIGDHAFEDATDLSEINLENVKRIGNYAFYGSGVKKIRLNCDKIGSHAFGDCYNLEEAEVDCKTTGEMMFTCCDLLQRAVLKHTKVLAEGTFYSANLLTEITLPPELKVIESSAFSYSGIKSLKLPRSVKKLEKNIANGVAEIHIYDNYESDISPEKDISAFNYILYVHSAQTDEIIYAVPIIGRDRIPTNKFRRVDGNGHDRVDLAGLFMGGVRYDFKEYDRCFKNIYEPEEQDKFRASMTRLKYGCEPDEEARRNYAELLDELGYSIAQKFIRGSELNKALDPELYAYMSLKNLLPLIDLSAKHGLTELTAYLMQKCNEKRAES